MLSSAPFLDSMFDLKMWHANKGYRKKLTAYRNKYRGQGIERDGIEEMREDDSGGFGIFEPCKMDNFRDDLMLSITSERRRFLWSMNVSFSEYG